MRLFPLLVLYAACVLTSACGKTASDADATGGASGGEGGAQARLTAIACSTEQACVLDENGALTCWGDLRNGSPPDANYVSVVGGNTVSALTKSGEVVTWGGSTIGCPKGKDCLANLPGPHATISYGVGLVRYYLDRRGRVTSSRDNWGDSVSPAQRVYPDSRPKEEFSSLTFSLPFVCGLRSDGSFLCWSESGLGTPPVDDGQHTYSELDYKSSDLCGITKEDGSLICFGSTYDGPTGKGYRAVVHYFPPSDARRCGLTAAGDLDCSTSPHEQMVPAGASLDKVCSGNNFVCGIRFDGKVSCWGRENGNFTDDPLILRIPESIAAK